MNGQLSENEVERRLALCTDVKVGDELYEFGERLLNYRIDISHRLDSKASAMAGYAGVVLTVLLSTYGTWESAVGQVGFLIMALAGIAVFLAAVLAITAMALRDFMWFSQDDWLKEDCLVRPTITKGYRVLTLWGVLSSYENICAHKAARLRKAQVALSIAGLLLLFALLHVTAFHTVCAYRLWIPSW
jgi:hypothetical protein